MAIGTRIKEARRAANLSRAELSKRTGVPYPTLAGLENGDQNSTTKLHVLADVLGVSPHWLETGQGPMRTTPNVNEPSNQSGTSQTGRLDAFNVAVTARALQAFLARRGVTFDITRPEHAELFCEVYAEAVAMPDDDPAAMAALGAVVADLVEHRGKREKARAEVDQAAGGAGVRRGRRVSGA